MISRNIFRQYDIRGLVPEELDDDTVRRIAQAFATMAAEKGLNKVVLGRDNRKSSPHLREVAVEALTDSGCQVIDLGVVVSPMFYFAARHLEIPAGLMITASHNPGEYNGFKVLIGENTIYGDEIQRLYRLAQDGVFTPQSPKGKVTNLDITEDYINNIKQRISLGPRRLKLVVDCGNGTASFFAPRLFRELGCEVVELYCESDPDFPNHHPDPVKVENCQDLIRAVKSEKADLGIGLDGDGDRLGVVAEDGRIIWGDLLMILYWREILPRHPGIDCIVEVKCSQALIDEIVRLGGRPLLYKTGHSLIKAKMKEIGAIFTGEMSGHMFFADEYYGYDDALYAAARLLRILSNTDRSMSQLLADVPQYWTTPEIRVKSSDTEKFLVVEKVGERFRKEYEVIDVDGARIIFPDGWGLVRASNTGPELIVRYESRTEEGLKRIGDELCSFLSSLGLEIKV